MLRAEVNASQRKPDHPKKSFRECVKEDLKYFKSWNRKLWRTIIHKERAGIFQKEWENISLQKKAIEERKTKPKYCEHKF